MARMTLTPRFLFLAAGLSVLLAGCATKAQTGAMAGAAVVWQLMDRRETERDFGQNIAERIGKDFFKGLR